jgi:hypothetical protein
MISDPMEAGLQLDSFWRLDKNEMARGEGKKFQIDITIWAKEARPVFQKVVELE